MQVQVNLAAGGPAVRHEIAGKYLVLLETGAAASVELWLRKGNEELEYIRTAKRGLRLTALEGFTEFLLKSTVNAACEVVVSMGRVDVGFIDGVAVNATIAGPLPLPVSNDRGSPGNLLFVSGVSLADAPATSLNEPAAVAVNDTVDVLVAANANRRAIRFHNIGPDPVAIGSPTITWAKRVIVLEAGDVWVEDRAANLAWSGITAATTTASVTVQEVLA